MISEATFDELLRAQHWLIEAGYALDRLEGNYLIPKEWAIRLRNEIDDKYDELEKAFPREPEYERD